MSKIKSLTPKKVGEIFHLDPRTVRKHYQEFGGAHIGRKYHFTESKVLEIFESRNGGKLRQSCDPNVLTIDKWLGAYIEECKRRFVKETYMDKKRSKELFMSYLRETGGLSPSDIVQSFDRSDARIYMAYQFDKRGPNGANKERKHLSAAWNWGEAFLEGFPEDKRNPFLGCKRYPGIRKPRYVPPEEDFWKVYNSANLYDKAILKLFLYTAGRRCEIFRLDWEDINLEANTIRLSTRKTKNSEIKYSLMPIPSGLKPALTWLYLRKSSKCNKVLTHNGLPYTKGVKIMPKLCRQAGLKKPFTFHAIRHLAATLLSKAGFTIFEIQHALRHEKQSTTDDYLHSLGAFEAVAKAMDSLSKRQPRDRDFQDVA